MLTTFLDVLGIVLIVGAVVLAPLYIKFLIIAFVVLSTSYLIDKKGN